MNSQNTTPDPTTDNDDKLHNDDHRRGPRGRGFGPHRGFGHGGPTIVIQNGAPQQFGPHRGFGPHQGFGPGHGIGHHGTPPKKGDIRLFKRVRRLAAEVGKYRGTATSEQRAQARAKLNETIVEIKRILAS